MPTNQHLSRAAIPLLSVLLLAADAPGPAPVAIRAAWKKGDKIDLVIEKRKEDSRKPESARIAFRMEARIEVLEKDETGYLLQWTYGKSDIEAPHLTKEMKEFLLKSLAPVLSIMEGLAMRIRTDADGSPTGLENIDEMQKKMREAMEVLLREQKKGAGEKPETMQKILDEILKPETLETIILKEPTAFLAAAGCSFTDGKANEGDVELPNPFGGEPIPSRCTVTLKESLPEEAKAVVEIRQVPHPEKASAIIAASLNEMARRMGGPPIPADKMPKMEIESSIRCVVDTATGWPRSVEAVQRVKADSDQKIERMTIRVASPAAPAPGEPQPPPESPPAPSGSETPPPTSPKP